MPREAEAVARPWAREQAPASPSEEHSGSLAPDRGRGWSEAGSVSSLLPAPPADPVRPAHPEVGTRGPAGARHRAGRTPTVSDRPVHRRCSAPVPAGRPPGRAAGTSQRARSPDPGPQGQGGLPAARRDSRGRQTDRASSTRGSRTSPADRPSAPISRVRLRLRHAASGTRLERQSSPRAYSLRSGSGRRQRGAPACQGPSDARSGWWSSSCHCP